LDNHKPKIVSVVTEQQRLSQSKVDSILKRYKDKYIVVYFEDYSTSNIIWSFDEQGELVHN